MISAYADMVGKLPLQFQLEQIVESYICDYLCDTTNDLEQLPPDCEVGSVARVLEPPSIYLKNSEGNWVLQMSIKKLEA